MNLQRVSLKCVYMVCVASLMSLSRGQAAGLNSADSNAINNITQAQEQQAHQILERLLASNKYWLAGPSPEVHGFSYAFKLRTSPRPIAYDVNNPAQAKSSIRQGITYFSLLQEIALEPNNISIVGLEDENSIAKLTLQLTKPVKMHVGNGIEKHWFGSFSRPMQKGTIWIDQNRNVPLKAEIGTEKEQYLNYLSAGQNQYVPLRITVDEDMMHFDFAFKFYMPGLWLFDTSQYRTDKDEYYEAAKYSHVAIITNVRVNNKAVDNDSNKPDKVQSQMTIGSITYAGGDGTSMEQAVFIKNAKDEMEGVEAESKWIQKMHPGWRKGEQRLLNKNGRVYDEIDYLTASNETKTIYFDITEFFGKMD
jgi:hypothetical protein